MSVYISRQKVQRFRRIQATLDRLDPAEEPQALTLPGSPHPRESVIIFTASFNPPTLAHLALLKEAQRYAREHEPMQVFAAMSKHIIDKEMVERPLLADRLLLLSEVLRRRLPHAGILVFNRGLYVEQAQAIRASFPGVKRILLLVGFDKIVQILDPRYYDDRDVALTDLFKLAELLVAPRGADGQNELHALLQRPENQGFAHAIHSVSLNSAYRDISSSEIRQGSAGYEHDIPQEVRAFLRETRAYSPLLQDPDGHELDAYEQRVCRFLGKTRQDLAAKAKQAPVSSER